MFKNNFIVCGRMAMVELTMEEHHAFYEACSKFGLMMVQNLRSTDTNPTTIVFPAKTSSREIGEHLINQHPTMKVYAYNLHRKSTNGDLVFVYVPHFSFGDYLAKCPAPASFDKEKFIQSL